MRKPNPTIMAQMGLLLGATILAVGCGGSSSSAPDPCASLTGMTIPASSIGLATNGAKITSATRVAASSAASGVEFCKVVGEIYPTTTSDTPVDYYDSTIAIAPITTPNINFNVALPIPTAWNSKSLHYGGGGFDGTVPAVDNASANGITDPLARGYVTLADDSGHAAPYAGGAPNVMWNAEATRNFGREAIKKTHDAAMSVVKAYYGQVPTYNYFMGGSQGGHEALIAAQFYPMDFEGVVVGFPAYNLEAMHPGSIDYSQTLYRARTAGVNGFNYNAVAGEGWVSRPMSKYISKQIMYACGATADANGTLDLTTGKDGIVYNPGATTCATYRASLYKHDATNPLRCTAASTGASADGLHNPANAVGSTAWAAETCLSDAQIETLARITSRYNYITNGTTAPNVILEGGIKSYGKWPIMDGMWFGEADAKDATNIHDPGQQDFGSAYNVYDAFQATFPCTDQLGMLTHHNWSWTSTGNDNIAKFDIATYINNGRLQEVSSYVDSSSVDYETFRGRGGKMIHYHGAADVSITPYNSIDLFLRMSGQFQGNTQYLGTNGFFGSDDTALNSNVSQRSDAAVSNGIVDDFYSFYLVPGFGHGIGYFQASVDWLKALENWREKDIAPRNTMVSTDTQAAHTSLGTRPVCVFPYYPQYKGTGDAKVATNYTCTKLAAYSNLK